MPRLLLAVVCALSAAAAQDSLLETFVATFTGTSNDEAKDLLDTLETCTSDVDNQLFRDVLRMSVNATRACTTTQVDRGNYKKCIDRAATAVRMASSPYDIFSTQQLTDDDIAALASCETSLESDDAIIRSYLVIVKRFLQCDVTLTDEQRTAVLDVFQGDGQAKELQRAQLSNLCGALRFSGETHREFVLYVQTSLKNYAALFPTRRA